MKGGWDDASTVHISRHKVPPEEAERIVLGASLPIEMEERSGEDRHTELGETAAGRLLLVTAFPANRKWREMWRRRKGGHDAKEETG